MPEPDQLNSQRMVSDTQQLRATHEPVRRQIDALLDEYTDAQVARILNEKGLHIEAGRLPVVELPSVFWT